MRMPVPVAGSTDLAHLQKAEPGVLENVAITGLNGRDISHEMPPGRPIHFGYSDERPRRILKMVVDRSHADS
jgi:hypothetical protein